MDTWIHIAFEHFEPLSFKAFIETHWLKQTNFDVSMLSQRSGLGVLGDKSIAKKAGFGRKSDCFYYWFGNKMGSSLERKACDEEFY